MSDTTAPNAVTAAYLSIRDAATALGVPEPTVRGWALRGVVDSVRIGGRRLIARAALERLAPAAVPQP